MIAVVRRLRHLRCVSWAALLWLVLEGTASADDSLAEARKAVAESDYAAALPALVATLDAGGHPHDELAEIYRLTGIVEAALGDAPAATDAFIHLLVLSPTATLPDGTSPKITRPFDAAGRYVASHGVLEIQQQVQGQVETVAVVSDPLNMAATVRVVGASPDTQDRELVAGRLDIALPGEAESYRWTVLVLDVHGNVLAGLVSLHDVLLPDPAPAASPIVVRAAPRPVYLRWWPYAAAGVVTLAATTYFGLAARSATDDLNGIIARSAQHSYGDARVVEDRARRDVLLTNIGLGVTGALAITAGVLYVLRPHDRVEVLSGVAPLPGGGQLVLGGRY